MKTLIVNINYFHRVFGFSDISFLQYTLKYIVQQLHKIILILDQFFLKYEEGKGKGWGWGWGGVGVGVLQSVCLRIFQYVLSTTADRIN